MPRILINNSDRQYFKKQTKDKRKTGQYNQTDEEASFEEVLII